MKSISILPAIVLGVASIALSAAAVAGGPVSGALNATEDVVKGAAEGTKDAVKGVADGTKDVVKGAAEGTDNVVKDVTK